MKMRQAHYLGLAFVLLCTAAGASPKFYAADAIAGRLVDAKTGKPVVGAVVSASWMLQRMESPEPITTSRLQVQQVRSDKRGRFKISRWQHERRVPRGWALVPGQDPVVRIYAEGYQRLELDAEKLRRPESERGKATLKPKTLRLKRLATPEANMRELATWRQDIDAEILAFSQVDVNLAKASQKELLLLFDSLCEKIPEMVYVGVCFEPTSELGIYISNLKAVSRNAGKLKFHGSTGQGGSVMIPATSPGF